MTWSEVQPSAEALTALDPYLEWAKQTQYAYYFFPRSKEDWFPVLMELSGITAEQFASGKWHAPSGWESWLRIPPLYAHPPAGLKAARFCTAGVRWEFFRQLADDHSTLRQVIRRVALSLPTPVTQPTEYKPLQVPRSAPKPGVVVAGIIDDGIAFAHERFRLGDETRVEYLWNQDGPPGGAGGVLYGRELVKHDVGAVDGIDTVMAKARHGGPLVDEEEVYRLTGHIDLGAGGHKPAAQRAAHGTHVMDVAYGERADANEKNRPIIAVQLPVATTRQTSGALLATPVLDGLRYILDRADQLAAREQSGPLPVVVNLSYGFHAGPHDGSSILEAAIDELIVLRREAAPMSVVLPVGNGFLARCHAQFTLGLLGQQRLLHWRIQPDDYTPSFMEVWLPQRTPTAKIALRVKPPCGDLSPWIREGEVYEWRPRQDVLCKVIYFDAVASGRPRNMVLIAVAPTTTHRAATDVAPAGRWEVRVRNLGPAATLDAWIQRDDTPFGYPIWGRQSRFDDPRYKYRDDAGWLLETDSAASYVKRTGTISAMATGRETVVVGGFRRFDATPATYSASGPIIGTPHRAGPDISTVCEDAAAHYGVHGAGTRSGSSIALNGTSVAAPRIARWIAQDMASGNAGDRASVTAIPTNVAGVVPPARGGITRVAFPPRAPRYRPHEP